MGYDRSSVFRAENPNAPQPLSDRPSDGAGVGYDRSSVFRAENPNAPQPLSDRPSDGAGVNYERNSASFRPNNPTTNQQNKQQRVLHEGYRQ